MDSLVINQWKFYHLAGTLICELMSIPDCLQFRKVKLYHTATDSQ